MGLPVVAGIWTGITGIGSYAVAKLGVDIVKRIVLGTFFVTLFAFFVTFIYFFFDAVSEIYNLINTFLSYIEDGAPGTSTALQNFYGLLECSGVIDGINATDGMVLSAVAFTLLFKLMYHFGTFAYLTYTALSKVIK